MPSFFLLPQDAMPAHWSFRLLIIVALIAGWVLGGASPARMADRIEQPRAIMTVDAGWHRQSSAAPILA